MQRLRSGALAAVLMALACQMALVAADLPDRPALQDRSALASVSVMCHSPAPGEAPPQGHTHPAAAYCGFWLSAQPAVLPGGIAAVPEPAVLLSWRGGFAQARAPPPSAIAAAYPRGPPILV